MKPPCDELQIQGYTLRPTDPERRAWSYLPLRPELERRADGRPALDVIQAGAVAFVQCTARLGLDEEPRARLLRELARQEPGAAQLELAALAVERIALELRSDGNWVTAAESRGSGAAPHRAALSATLSAAALQALQAAVAGKRGRARLRAVVTPVRAAATHHASAAAAEVRLETPHGSAHASIAQSHTEQSSARAPEPLELCADLVELLAPTP